MARCQVRRPQRLRELVQTPADLHHWETLLPEYAQIQIASANGKQTFKLGLLGQFQAEGIDSAAQDVTSKNLFIRRLRVLGERLGPALRHRVGPSVIAPGC